MFYATEAQEQEMVMDWCRWKSATYPELDLLFHIPNGGKRDAREAAHLKRIGVKPGVSDLFLPFPNGGFHGLWIEMKTMRGKPTQYQEEWIAAMRKNGYAAYICHGAEEAIAIISKYMMLLEGENDVPGI